MAWIAPFLAVFGISGAGGERLPPGLLDHMPLMRSEVSGVDKQHLIDATTIVCTHSGVDEVQCGICLQSLEQGVQLRMAQCCHKFHDDCLTEWFKTHLDCPQCRVKLSEMMDSINSVESGGKTTSCGHAAHRGGRAASHPERSSTFARQASASPSSASNSASSSSSALHPRRAVAAGGGLQDLHMPAAAEHRWPEGPSSGIVTNVRIPGFGRRAVSQNTVRPSAPGAHNDVQRGVGVESSNPIVIDDSPTAAARSSRADVHVVVLSSDSD